MPSNTCAPCAEDKRYAAWGEYGGALPPPPGQCPGPNSGCNKLYLSYSFPVKQSNMHTYFCRERMCFCELGAPQLHAETPSLIRMVALRAGCGLPPCRIPFAKEDCIFANWVPALRATQKPLCRGRLFLCELDAPQAPAHGLGGGTPPTGCFASGENDKKEAVRECILSAALFFVFIAPVGSLSVSPSTMRKEV